MKKQFFYKRVIQITPKTEENPAEFKTFVDSFNLDVVCRSIEIEDGKCVVLLNDLHEDMVDDRTKPIIGRNNELKGFKQKKGTLQSEIVLEADDAERFKELTSID